jgi:peptidoglycan L-alanyl-D-glutamate endopeptidase CwlK
MSSRNISDLHPKIAQKAALFLEECKNRELPVIITSTRRSSVEQAALYAQGREPMAVVNGMRIAAGMQPLEEEGYALAHSIVTLAKAGESIHEYGLAFDAVPLWHDKPMWDKSNPLWYKMGWIGGIVCDLEWGGIWSGKMVDFPHFQHTTGLSIADLKAGRRPLY